MTTQAASFTVWRRYLSWRGSRRVWSRWFPMFTVIDARNRGPRTDYTPLTQVRLLLRDQDEKYAREWTADLKAGKRPLGQSWRITRGAATRRA